jgi:hypothetical protein
MDCFDVTLGKSNISFSINKDCIAIVADIDESHRIQSNYSIEEFKRLIINDVAKRMTRPEKNPDRFC